MLRTKYSQILRRSAGGFTIIELMIATLVFSTILIILTFGVIALSHAYYRGVVTSSTQSAARDVLNDIAQAIQLGGVTASSPPVQNSSGTVSWTCVGPDMFTYQPGYEFFDGTENTSFQTSQGLIFSTLPSGGCPTSAPAIGSLTGQDLIGPHMRVSDLRITPEGSNLYQVVVTISYGDDDLLCNTGVTSVGGQPSCDVPAAMTTTDNTDYTSSPSNGSGGTVKCKAQAGEEFCTVSSLTTTVQGRN